MPYLGVEVFVCDEVAQSGYVLPWGNAAARCACSIRTVISSQRQHAPPGSDCVSALAVFGAGVLRKLCLSARMPTTSGSYSGIRPPTDWLRRGLRAGIEHRAYGRSTAYLQRAAGLSKRELGTT